MINFYDDFFLFKEKYYFLEIFYFCKKSNNGGIPNLSYSIKIKINKIIETFYNKKRNIKKFHLTYIDIL